jgi:hypothetical protein
VVEHIQKHVVVASGGHQPTFGMAVDSYCCRLLVMCPVCVQNARPLMLLVTHLQVLSTDMSLLMSCTSTRATSTMNMGAVVLFFSNTNHLQLGSSPEITLKGWVSWWLPPMPFRGFVAMVLGWVMLHGVSAAQHLVGHM